MIELRERMEKGLAVLEAKGPEGWRSKVTNENFLTICNPNTCLLHAIFGSYFDGLCYLGLLGHSMEHGFSCMHPHDKELTRLWREALGLVPL